MTQPQHDSQHDCEHPHCHELLSRLSDYVDGELDEALCAEIEKHMAECERCQIVIDTLRKTVELYRTLPTPPLPDDVRGRLLLRLNLEDFVVKGEGEGEGAGEKRQEKE